MVEWGGMNKRRGHGIANIEKASGGDACPCFSCWGITGKRRKLHPLDRRKPDPAAFVHATHLPPPISRFTLTPTPGYSTSPLARIEELK